MVSHLAHSTCESELHFEFELARSNMSALAEVITPEAKLIPSLLALLKLMS